MKRWPRLPRQVQGAGGPIRVVLRDHVEADGVDCWGTWCEDTRTIELDRTARPRHRWQTLWHEITHAALDDAGLSELMTPEGNEAVCRAMAAARVAEMQAKLAPR